MIESELFFVLFLVLKQCSFPIGINKVHQFNSIQFNSTLYYSINLGHNFTMTRQIAGPETPVENYWTRSFQSCCETFVPLKLI